MRDEDGNGKSNPAQVAKILQKPNSARFSDGGLAFSIRCRFAALACGAVGPVVPPENSSARRAPNRGCHTLTSAEGSSEVGCSRKANRRTDLCHRERCCSQQFLGATHALIQQILVCSCAGHLSEFPGKTKWAQARHSGDLTERDALVHMVGHEFQAAAEVLRRDTPFDRRGHELRCRVSSQNKP
jgi:hypothetical protein